MIINIVPIKFFNVIYEKSKSPNLFCRIFGLYGTHVHTYQCYAQLPFHCFDLCQNDIIKTDQLYRKCSTNNERCISVMNACSFSQTKASSKKKKLKVEYNKIKLPFSFSQINRARDLGPRISKASKNREHFRRFQLLEV